MWALAYDGGRLVSIDRTVDGVVDQFLSLHPANAAGSILGSTGENWNAHHGMDVDPTTGTIYAFYGPDMFVIDPLTGDASFAGELSGLLPFDCICSVAFLPSGAAWGVGFRNGALYSVNVSTRSATLVGIMPEVASGFGDFYDLAVDSSGQLWGIYAGDANGNPQGVYKIDTTNLTIQMVVANSFLFGIAFGPATPESFYCTAKTNSLGCVPTLEAEGLASPTATSGYRITADNVRNRTFGRLLYGVNGAASSPFAGGTLCLNIPWKGTSIVSSGGSASSRSRVGTT